MFNFYIFFVPLELLTVQIAFYMFLINICIDCIIALITACTIQEHIITLVLHTCAIFSLYCAVILLVQ